MRASQILPFLALISVLCQGCEKPTREQVEASVWKNTGLPAKLCAENIDLWKYGSYRQLDDAECEARKQPVPCAQWVRYCSEAAPDMVSIYGPQFTKYLDALLPKPPEAPSGG